MIHTSNNCQWIEPEWPAPDWVSAAITTRVGGSSDGSYSGWNLAQHVQDDANSVDHNRHCLQEVLSLPSSPVWLQQVHGCRVVNIEIVPFQ